METVQKKHEYKLDKYTFQQPYETITVVDNAVLDILSYNYDTTINTNSSYLEKVQLILSFLKLENIFETVLIHENTRKNTFTELRGKSGYAVLDSFLRIEFVSDHTDKYQIYEGYKKFNEYVSSFETGLKTRYESQNKQVARKWKKKQEHEVEEEYKSGMAVLIIIAIVFFASIYGIISYING
ncbi:hypothetical protein [Aquimarina macrocephali]|uniref:hypothetical protein n=1 Tax=Aquimarina macrocephali TaxID=666563 RepID=UPI0004669955|nr:hypothetical protein [Aquimarina macrocephali]